MQLTKREEKVLASIALRRGPVPSPTWDLVPELHPEAASLVEKGMLEQVWQLSEAGATALRASDDFRWIVHPLETE